LHPVACLENRRGTSDAAPSKRRASSMTHKTL